MACSPPPPALSRWERERWSPPLSEFVGIRSAKHFKTAPGGLQFPSPSGRGIKGEGERFHFVIRTNSEFRLNKKMADDF